MRYIITILCLIACNVAVAIEPQHILVGSPTATYYDGDGVVLGRTRLENDTIIVYDRNVFSGKVKLGRIVEFKNQGGALTGRAEKSGSRTQIYNKNGALAATIERSGSTALFKSAGGRLIGKAKISSGITRFEDADGNYIGKKQ